MQMEFILFYQFQQVIIIAIIDAFLSLITFGIKHVISINIY